MKPETKRQQGRKGRVGSHLHIERREMEGEFIDVGLPICSPKS